MLQAIIIARAHPRSWTGGMATKPWLTEGSGRMAGSMRRVKLIAMMPKAMDRAGTVARRTQARSLSTFRTIIHIVTDGPS